MRSEGHRRPPGRHLGFQAELSVHVAPFSVEKRMKKKFRDSEEFSFVESKVTLGHPGGEVLWETETWGRDLG